MILEFVEYIEIRQRPNFYCSEKHTIRAEQCRAVGIEWEEKKTFTEHCYYFGRHDNSLEGEQSALANVLYGRKIKSRDGFSGKNSVCYSNIATAKYSNSWFCLQDHRLMHRLYAAHRYHTPYSFSLDMSTFLLTKYRWLVDKGTPISINISFSSAAAAAASENPIENFQHYDLLLSKCLDNENYV